MGPRVFAAALFFTYASCVAGQALMGIDLGSHEVKIATIKNSEFAIVLNEAAKRKSVNVLGFDGEERIFGEGAANLRGRLPQSVIVNAHHLLGIKAGAPTASKFGSNQLPVPVETDAERSSVMFKVGSQKLQAEEVVGHSLHYMAQMTKLYGKHPEVQSCVIAVPPHFTDQARLALRAAAEIAGVRVITVVNDNAAVALRYGQERAVNAKDETVLFIDVGAAFTSASVAKYTSEKGKPKVQVQAVSWDEELGGRQFDERLAEYLADEFDKQNGLKIRSNLKAYTKLLTAAAKAKMQLSANDMTVVSIGSLMNDKDFSLKVDRSKLDELCADLYAKIAAPVKQVLDATKMQVSQFDHVIPFGGGWRVPGLQKVLTEELAISKLEPILNSDEAAAFGAVFIHGNNSGLLRVREIVFEDLSTPPKATDYPVPLRGAAMGAAKNKHSALCDAEEVRLKKSGAKSSLEAWIYSVKEKMMEDEMENLASEDEIAEVNAVLSAGEDWIYDEGENVELEAYEAKRAEVEKKVGAVVERYEEFLVRPDALEAAKSRVSRALSNVEDWKVNRKHIPAADLGKLKKQADELKSIMEKGEKQLAGEGLKGPLPFKAEDIRKKATALKDLEDTLLLMRPEKEL